MKAKTIKQTISRKIGDWIESIDDEALRERVSKNTIVTGGSIASMLMREPINDYDVYFKDRQTALLVAQYYVGKFKPKHASGIDLKIHVDETKEDRIGVIIKSAGIASEGGSDNPYEYFEAKPEGEASEYIDSVMSDAGDSYDLDEATRLAVGKSNEDGRPKYRPIFMSTNAVTLSNKVQLVLRFYGEPDELHENYDFVHCTNYWTSWDGNLVLRPAALEAILTKELRYIGSKYPVCSIIRLRKFIARGWTVNAGQILKMVMQASDLDLNNIETLKDQLTGVDAAYFCEVIHKIKQKGSPTVDSAYLIEVIDRIF